MIIVIAALFGTSWISTEEKMPSSQLDASSFFYHSSNITVSYIIKSSNASLWIICTRLGKEKFYDSVVTTVASFAVKVQCFS